MIRPITLDDAPIYHSMLTQLDQESRWMSTSPGERSPLAQTRRQLLATLAAPNSMIFVAQDDDSGQLIGYLGCYGGKHERNRHRAAITVAVLAAWRGKGVATALFAALWQWVAVAGLLRVEVDVVGLNRAALQLYKNQGFLVEGIRCDSILIDGEYHSEVRLARLLKGFYDAQ